MKRAAALVLVMLAMSAAVDARALAREGQKTQWAPTRNFSSLNARAVFAGESRGATSPYAGEDFKTAAAAKEAGFTGHRTEEPLGGLISAEQRWLDPLTGTWMSRDPVGAASYLQSPNELNPWLYAAGNPTRYTDPDGRRLPWPAEANRSATLFALENDLWAEYSRQPLLIQALGSTGNQANEVAAYRRAFEAAIARAPDGEPVVLTGQSSGFPLYPSQSVLAMRGLGEEEGLNEYGAAWFPTGAKFSTASEAWANSKMATLSSLSGSPLAAGGYIGADIAGASDETKDAVANVGGVLWEFSFAAPGIAGRVVEKLRSDRPNLSGGLVLRRTAQVALDKGAVRRAAWRAFNPSEYYTTTYGPGEIVPGPGVELEASWSTGLRPRSFGMSTIAEVPELHQYFQAALRETSGPGRANAFTKYLDKIERGEQLSNNELNDAWATVQGEFLQYARQAGYPISQVHHWNYPKQKFPLLLTDPRQLVPVWDRATHQMLHESTTSNTAAWNGIWLGPVAPNHEIELTPLFPLAPR